MERKIPCVYMRGGTSKACFFHREDLPEDVDERDRTLLRIFGSPDPKQIDGMGGTYVTTSKAAIIEPSSRDDADIDYEFNQIGIDTPLIDKNMNCGNISSAVGPYAISEGLVEATDPVTLVRIYNRNTGKIIYSHVPTEDGQVLTQGDYSIDGVPGTGARIDLEFFEPQGSATGKLLPTGNALDTINIDGTDYEYSFVDAANPMVFIKPEQFGIDPVCSPDEFESLPDIKEIKRKIEIIRGTCAVIAGLASDLDDAKKNSPGLPKVIWCAPPVTYQYKDKNISADDIDIVARLLSVNLKMNPSMAVTGAICIGAAACTPGTIVYNILEEYGCKEPDTIFIGHPCGVIDVKISLDENGEVKSCQIGRTARRIMEGFVYA